MASVAELEAAVAALEAKLRGAVRATAVDGLSVEYDLARAEAQLGEARRQLAAATGARPISRVQLVISSGIL